VRVLQFLSVILAALAFVPGGVHLFELPNKIGLSQERYVVVQSIYRGWALFGVVIFAAIGANLLLAVKQWRGGRSYRLTLTAGLLLVAALAVFFEWTYPVNQATNNWSMVVADWESSPLAMGAVARGKRDPDLYRVVLCNPVDREVG
jgi:hypothetical protein